MSLETSYIRNVQSVKPLDGGDQKGIYFKLTTASGEYLISAHELARALFFHDSYLVDAAFRPNGLFELASCDIGDEDAVIRFPETTEYPVSKLDARQTKQHLISLFLNKDYEKSFGSVFGKRFKANDFNCFQFDFSPPSLNGLHFEVLCEKRSDGALIVYEVSGIQNRSFFYDGVVHFIHPRKKDVAKKEASGEKTEEKRVIKRPNQSEKIDLGKSPGFGGKKNKVNDNSFYFSFLSSVKTNVRNLNRKHKDRKTGKSVTGVKKSKPSPISAGRKTAEGDANFVEPHLSADNSILASQEGANTIDRFNLFIETIDTVVDELKCQNYKIVPVSLPKPKDEDKYVKWINSITGKPRLVCVARFRYKEVVFIALDIDIADIENKHTISSRLVVFGNDKKSAIKDRLNVLLEAISNSKTISWPEKELMELCDVDVRIIHPRKKLYESIDDPQVKRKVYVESWKLRWIDKMNGVVDS